MNYSPHILIVDDNQGIHRDFTLALCNESHNPELQANEERVFGVTSGPVVPKPLYDLEHALVGLEGVEKVRESVKKGYPFQLAFVDIRMPGIDGVETVERIWEIDPAIQVVLCTAYADYSWDDLARRLGHTDKALVLKKPFDYIEVVQMASTLTEKWFLGKQAALKLEQMELLVAQRTRKLLDLQRCEFERLRELDRKAPRAQEAPAPEAGRIAASVVPVDSPELPLILLAGANPEVRDCIAAGLENQCRVIEASEADESFDRAREMVPDVVIASFAMPRSDGLELCRRLKSDELASHVPVIMVDAEVSELNQIKALEAGAEYYIGGPFSQSALLTQVQALLQSSRKEFNQKAPLQPRDIATNQVDARFLRRTTEIVDAHMSDFEFDVEGLAQKMFMSRRQLLRKLKGVAGCSPNAFIRALRLKRAGQLLKSSGMTVSEVTYAVGFSDLKHFRAVFREQFGVSPAEYGRSAD